MFRVNDECAAMAVKMLDAELLAIARKLADGKMRTPLQLAVQKELEKRNLQILHSLSLLEQPIPLRKPGKARQTG